MLLVPGGDFALGGRIGVPPSARHSRMVVPSSIHHRGFDGVADGMPGGGRRPYARKTIGELEAIFAHATRGSQALSDLGEELRFRSTYRATRLQARVAAAYPDASQAASSDHFGRSAQTPAANKPGAAKQTPRPAPSPVVAQPKVEPSAAGPADPPGSRPKATTQPRTPNEPGAILSTWIALEALSPQTYRRPEDRAGGDRRCVADLGGTRLPWQSGERSRPKETALLSDLPRRASDGSGNRPAHQGLWGR